MLDFLQLRYIIMGDKVVVLLAAKGFKFPQTSQKPANFKSASSRQFEQRKKNYNLFISFLNHGNFLYTKKNYKIFSYLQRILFGVFFAVKEQITAANYNFSRKTALHYYILNFLIPNYGISHISILNLNFCVLF